MSYFVQQHLLHGVHICALNKVLRERNSLFGVIAKSRPANGSVKTEGVIHQTVLLK